MFEGGGFGVGLTVNQLDVPPCPGGALVSADPDWHPTRLGELMPVAARSDSALAEEVRRANIADRRLWAYRVELIVQLAYRRRDDRDIPSGTPGSSSPSWAGTSQLPEGVSEFFLDEVAMIMNCSRAEATALTAVSWTLIHHVPDTWAALADGELTWSPARAIAQEIGRHGSDLDPHVARTVEAVVLPQAAELPVARLRSLVRTEVVRYDAEAVERRRRQAEAAADVFLRRSALEGMAEVVTVVPQPVAAAIGRTVDAHARRAKADGDARPIGQIRAELMTHLTLRPWDDRRPAVTAELRVLAPLNSLLPDPAEPETGGRPPGVAEVDMEPITAAHLRALLVAIDAVCPGGLQAPAGGSLHLDLLGAGGGLLATLTRRELEQAVRRGCSRHPDGTCRCALVRRPARTDRPTALGQRSRPRLSSPRLPQPGRPDGSRPRHPTRRGRGDRLPQPVLPVPQAPPAQDPRTRLALPPRRGRRPPGHHPQWRHPDQSPTGQLPPGAVRAGRVPARIRRPRPGAVLSDPLLADGGRLSARSVRCGRGSAAPGRRGAARPAAPDGRRSP